MLNFKNLIGTVFFFPRRFIFFKFLLTSPSFPSPTNIYRHTHAHKCRHTHRCICMYFRERFSRRCYIGGFSQFGINANLCCYVCVCLSVDIALKLLLYRTSTEKYNETYRRSRIFLLLLLVVHANEIGSI